MSVKNLDVACAPFFQSLESKSFFQHLNTDVNLVLSGLLGSSVLFTIDKAYEAHKGIHLVIAEDKEQASFWMNDLVNLRSGKDVCYFPDSFKHPTDFLNVNKGNVLLRADTVNEVSRKEDRGQIIITYPEALFEQVVNPKELESTKLQIILEEKLDVEFLTEVFVEYGFTRTDFVYEPGQFAIRGGIVDIFSFGNDFPYRVELFDDEVESIRTFDPSTQLSRDKIAKVSIIPNINTQFKQEQKVDLLQILPDTTTVWVKDYDQLVDRIQTCFDKAKDTIENIDTVEEEEREYLLQHYAFVQPVAITEGVKSFRSIEIGTSSKMKVKGESISFEIKPQPSFNKNFELLIQDFKKNMSNGVQNFIFTDSVKQIERFYSIFEDLKAEVEFIPVNISIHNGFIDTTAKIACYTDHQIFERYYKYKMHRGFAQSDAINIKLLKELQPGDYVTHLDHGVGKYSGLQKIEVNGEQQEAVRLMYLNNDILYVSINSLHKISKFVGKDGTPPKIHKLGSDTWSNLKRKTKKKVKDIAEQLIKLYAQRKQAEGFAFPEDGYLQNELEASFLYEDTPDQFTTSQAVKEDMMKPYPMDRLVCGDVGFGKTEIAIRAAFKAIVGGKQVALLVPTTILALQHYKTFSNRLKEFGVKVDYLNRFRTAKEKKEILKNLAAGELDLIIGTHGLLGKAVKFKDLGLLVVDEEQKFGVSAKEKLRALSVSVDTLTLTATPIPRTLQFSLLGARDLSTINTPPPNRQPIQTELRVFSDELIKEAIYFEVHRGGQVFFVHNRVQSLIDIAAMIKRQCPDLDIAVAHGKMEPAKLEDTLTSFINGKFDVLCSTNIIETGLDIANANTIIINNAHQFGLSDLHQLRGRVGRSNKKAFCYLFSPPLSTLTGEARKRLKTIEEFSDLGSGFNVAMKDMDIRGAGNLLGGEQSGFISDIGYETYQKILDEAIQELKEGDYKDIYADENKKKRTFVRDVQVELELKMLLPDSYVSSIQERLLLYGELDKIATQEGLDEYADKLADRFGPLPVEVENLFKALKLRWSCKLLGFERIHYKKQKLRCYFVSNPTSAYYETSTFKDIMSYVNNHNSADLSLKQTPNSLIMIRESLRTIEDVESFLTRLVQETV